VLDWLELPRDQRTALGGQPRVSGRLGLGAVVGRRVRDVQSRFRIVLGPMDFDRFGDFLPGGRSLPPLVDWVRNYVGFEFDWELQLVLARDEVPAIRLGREGQLGWTAWLGSRPSPADAGDVVFAPERTRSARAPLPAAA
jgi:type VI secretion system protein ImpH